MANVITTVRCKNAYRVRELNLKKAIVKAFHSLAGTSVSDKKIMRLLEDANRHQSGQEWSKAAECYGWALELDASRAAVWVQLGHSLKEKGDLQGAREAYEEAVQLDDRDAELHLHLGHLLKNMEYSKAAGLAFAKCLSLAPQTHDAYDQLLHLGWTHQDIVSGTPSVEEGFPPSAGQLIVAPELSLVLFESVRQMMAPGKMPRKNFPQGH